MDILPRVKNGQFAYTARYMLHGPTVDTLIKAVLDHLPYITSGDYEAVRRVAFNLTASKLLGGASVALFTNTAKYSDMSVIGALEAVGIVNTTPPSPGKVSTMTLLNPSAISDEYTVTMPPSKRGHQIVKTGDKRWVQIPPPYLQAINEYTASHVYAYQPGWSKARVTLTKDSVTYDRIYINNYFTYGRFIAPFQSLSRLDRATMTIDGAPTLECDFKAMHPTLLYNELGLEAPANMYELPGIPTTWTPYVKLGLLISINAKDFQAALAALQSRVPATVSANLILRQLAVRHTQIAKAFWSNAGMRLMNVESNISRVVLEKCMAARVPVLCMHDGFICKLGSGEAVKRVMRHAFAEVTGWEGAVGVGVK